MNHLLFLKLEHLSFHSRLFSCILLNIKKKLTIKSVLMLFVQTWMFETKKKSLPLWVLIDIYKNALISTLKLPSFASAGYYILISIVKHAGL